MRTIKWPALYQKSQTGAVVRWEISVHTRFSAQHRGDVGVITTTWGQVGGKTQTTEDVVTEGKNTGKKNATDAVEQAEVEAEAKWTKQLKKGYVKSVEEAESGAVDSVIEGGIAPMLAPSKIYPHFASKLQWPVWVDPKLDGTRMIAVLKDGKCSLWSRTRKRMRSLPHIERAIETQLGHHENLILDGEAFSYDYRHNFEDLLSFIRQESPKEGHEVVDYYVYDLPSHDGLFNDRHVVLTNLLKNCSKPLIQVQRSLAQNHEDVMRLHERNLAEEWEGSMVRGNGPYEQDRRSYYLQKLKNFQDAEYKIVDAEEGRGKDTGTVGAFVCVTPEGKTFRCRLKASYARRRELLENPDQWKNKVLTVAYQNLTSDNVPRFPIGKGLRDYG